MTRPDISRSTNMLKEEPWPSQARAWYALGIFTTALVFNFIDRNVLPLLVVPIKDHLHLTDTQMSILMGFAFICFYAIIGLPIARMVDTMSRRLILGIGIALWSGMTAICGLAQSFGQFFLFRMGVGIGEACNGPATFSLLSDLFPPQKLPKALAILNLGYMFGTGIALLVGGTIIGVLAKMPNITLPVIGTIESWQMTFFAVGLPGLLIAALLRTIQEPIRRGLITAGGNQGTVAPAQTMPVKELIRFLYQYRRAYAPMYLALAIQSVMLTGVLSWLPALFIRQHGWTVTQYGQIMGVIFLVIAPIGLLLGGFLAEWLAGKGYHDANMRMVTISAVTALPFLVLAPLVANPYLALVLLAGQNFALGLAIGPQNAAFQVITPNQIRGQVTALYLFIINIIGFGAGPTVLALLTDYVFGNEEMVGYAMALEAGVMETLAVIVFWRGMKPYGERYAEIKAGFG